MFKKNIAYSARVTSLNFKRKFQGRLIHKPALFLRLFYALTLTDLTEDQKEGRPNLMSRPYDVIYES